MLAAFPVAVPSAAQNTTATVTGLVLDDQKLPVAGATIVVEDTNRGLTRTTTSAKDGTFEVAGLQPGEFRLTASLDRFCRDAGRRAPRGQPAAALDVVLKPGGLSEDVVVHQTAPLLDTVSSSVGAGDR